MPRSPARAVRAWSVASGEAVAGAAWPNSTPRCLVLDPSGRTLAVAFADGTVRLWDVASNDELHTLRGHAAAVLGLAFSPDGKTLATAAADHTVRLWDAEAGGLRGTLEGHSGSVLAVGFSPDGRTLASCGADRVVKLWHAATGREPVMIAARLPENPLAASLSNAAHRQHRDRLAQRTRDTRTILAKLEEPISMSFFEETPIGDILKYIKQATTTPSFSGIPIHVDPIGLKEADKSLESPVRGLEIESSPLKRTLQLLLSQLDLTYRVADGRLTIISKESREAMFGATLDTPRPSVNLDNPKARQLLGRLEQPIVMSFGSGIPLEDLLKYIKQATTTATYSGIPIYADPIGLSEADKTMASVITYNAGGVPLRQSLHEMLSQLGLTYVVGDELVMITSKSAEDPSSNGTFDHLKTIRMLEQPVELSFPEPTPLGDVIAAIKVATKNLDDAGMSIDVAEVGPEETLKLVYRSMGKPLRESLKEILTPLGLMYKVQGGGVVIMRKEETVTPRESKRPEEQQEPRPPR